MSPRTVFLTFVAAGLCAPAIAAPFYITPTEGAFTPPTALAYSPPVDMPKEITVQATDIGLVFADSQGMTLYTSGRGRECVGWCADDWEPLLVPEGFEPKGDWSIRERTDSRVQMTYKEGLLYRYIDDVRGRAKGNGHRQIWNAITYVPPEPQYTAPSGIKVKWDKYAYVLTNSSGATLHVFKTAAACEAACGTSFVAVQAPLTAKDVGDWRTSLAKNGERNWLYKDQTVYVPRDAAGPSQTVEGWQTIKAGQG